MLVSRTLSLLNVVPRKMTTASIVPMTMALLEEGRSDSLQIVWGAEALIRMS